MSAVIQNNYTQLNNSTVQYNFTFPYLKASDIKVSLDAVATTAFTLANATTIQLNSVPAVGTKIKIFRETGVDSLTATFYAGSAIKSEDLNDNFTQNLYKTQEVGQRALSTLGDTMTGNLNFGEDVDLVFEGATDNSNETTLTVADPTQPNTITLPNVTGTVVTTGDTGTVATGMIANDAVTMDKLNSGALPTDVTVASANIVDGTIVNADVNAAAAIDGTKIDPAFGSQNISTTGTAATGAHTVTGNIAVSGTVDGRDVAADGTKLDGIETAATADQTAAEIRTLVESATDSNVFTDADHTKLNGIDTGATDDQTASEIKTLIASSPLDSSHLAANSVTTSEIADAELTTLAGMQSGTASKLADSTALTADIADLNQIDGLTKQTTISDTDSSFPTSGAVVDYVTAQIDEIGGFEAIANELSFPNTQPGAGVAISIADAAGIVVSGSNSSTTARTVGGTTVTINNISSQFTSSTIPCGVRFIVTSTGSGHVYNYHKATLPESDLANLSGDINDFNERYRVGSTNPTSSLDSGDMFFNTSTGKMLVYNGTNSAWEEVQSIGNFFISTLSPAFNGSAQNFTITNAPTNAEQILLVINGVVQKPNAGTSTPSEGFALDGSTIKLGAAPAAGDSYHAVVIGSTVNIGTPSNNTVSSAILQNGSVIEAKIGTDAVTTAKIADSAVTTAKIADANVTEAKIANGAVTANKLGNNSVYASAIVNTNVTGDKIAVNAIATAKIQDDAVTTAKIADGAVTGAKIADATIGHAKIADESITLAKLSHGTSSTDGKFLRSNNGADPTFETVSGTTINNNADNKIITGSGTANTLEAEANATYNGTKLFLKGGSGSDGHIDMLELKHLNTSSSTTNGTGDGPSILLNGYYSSNEWALAKIAAVNAGGQYGSGYGGGLQFWVHPANGTQTASVIKGAEIIGDGTGADLYITNGNIKMAAGHGIDFSAASGSALNSGSNNALLDDYEEGTWTPYFECDNNSQTVSYNSSHWGGHYTKIGNLVYATARFVWTSKSGNGAFNLWNLPFTSANSSNKSQPCGVTMHYFSGMYRDVPQGYLRPNDVRVKLGYGNGGAFSSLNFSNISGSGEFNGHITYYVS